MREIEHAFACPYCAEPITVLLDPTVPSQEYIEDCEVCCNPILIAYTTGWETRGRIASGAVMRFEARGIEQ